MKKIILFIFFLIFILNYKIYSESNIQTIEIIDNNSNIQLADLLGVISGPTPPPDNPVIPDLTQKLQEIGVTSIRNNGYWDNRLDIAGIFQCPDNSTYPSWDCDANDDSNYNWELSDDLVNKIVNGGFELFLRIGDNSNSAIRNFDFHGPQNETQENNWIIVGKKVIERYKNWNGVKPFQYIDIITEWPNKDFWDRSNPEFIEFWAKAFQAIKSAYPEYKVGGPGILKPTIDVINGVVENNLAIDFLTYLYNHNLKPDWLGWHLWQNDPEQYLKAGRQYRNLLDGTGDFSSVPWAGTGFFKDVELMCDAYGVSYLRETSSGDIVYYPDEYIYKIMNKKEGAAILTGTWIALQYAGIKRAFYYRAGDEKSDPNNTDNLREIGWSGLFYGDENASYKPKAYAFRLWSIMYNNYPNLLSVSLPVIIDNETKLWLLAGKGDSGYGVLVANLNDKSVDFKLNIDGEVFPNSSYHTNILQVDDENNGKSSIELNNDYFTIAPYTVQLIQFFTINSENNIVDIKVNGSDGDVTLYEDDEMNLTISVNSNVLNGVVADWKINIITETGDIFSYVYPDGWQQGDEIAYTGELVDFEDISIVYLDNLNGITGKYRLMFEIALNNGITFKDEVNLSILNAKTQIGLNFIRFYFDETNENFAPDVIFEDFSELGIDAYRMLVRAGVTWSDVEPENDQWNFENPDYVIMNSKIPPILVLFEHQYASPTPPWVTEPSEFQKTLGEDAKDYLIHVVTRYAPYVKYWELGNEIDHWIAASPENPFISSLPDSYPLDGFTPQEQGKFLAEAAEIIRQYDPDAVIILPGMGGLSENSFEWLEGVIEGGGTDWFDVINYHFYSSWKKYLKERQELDKILHEYNIDNKSVWNSETGSTSSLSLTERTDYPNTEESQAADVFRRIVQAWGAGDELVIWHTYIGSEDVPSNNWRCYGIKDEYGNNKLAYYSFKLLAHELTPFSKVEALETDIDGINSYKFTLDNGTIKYVVWGNGTYKIPDGITNMTNVIPDETGAFDWEDVNSGDLITLTENPVLLK